MSQTDGGYLGSDFEAFFSAVVSGAAGVYVGTLLHDADIETDLVVRPGQRVIVNGDTSLPQPPRWGNGGFTVQQRGSLSLSSMEMPAVSVSGGSLSVVQMALTSAQFVTIFAASTTPGSVVWVSQVIVPERTKTLTASLNVGADGVVVYDPPDFLNPSGLVRLPTTLLLVATAHGSDDGSRSRVAHRSRRCVLTGPARAHCSVGVRRQLHAQRVHQCGVLRGVPPGRCTLRQRQVLPWWQGGTARVRWRDTHPGLGS